MPVARKQNKSVRLPKKTVADIEELASLLQVPDAEDPSSSLRFSDVVRASVERSVRHVLGAPYWTTDARHFVHVTATGDFFYWFSEDLLVKEANARLAIRVNLKHDKMEEYIRDARAEGRELYDFLRSRWQFHAFRLRGPGEAGHWLRDEDGIGEKVVERETGLAGGNTVSRQGTTHLTGYVRWHQRMSDTDGAWLELRVPTRRLRFAVVVDAALYNHTPPNQRPGPNQRSPLSRMLANLEGEGKLELREAEEIRQRTRIGNVYPPRPGKSPDDAYHDAHAKIVEMARAADEFARAAAAALATPYEPPALPAAYSFSFIDIGPVWQGEHVGVTWPRPARPPA